MKRLLLLLIMLASVAGQAATYYVRPANGDDDNDGTSFAEAFKTTAKAVTAATAAGDIIYLCAEAVESPTAPIEMNVHGGDINNYIKYIGANSSGEVDGTKYTLNGASVGAGKSLINFYAAQNNLYFENIRFTAGVVYNLNNDSVSSDRHVFVRCEIDSAGSSGVYNNQPYSLMIFIDCDIHSNGGSGVVPLAGDRGGTHLFGSRVYNNANYGIASYEANTLSLIVDSSVIYRNGNHGVYLVNPGVTQAIIRNSVMYENGGSGIYARLSGMGVIYNCVLANNARYGFEAYDAGDANRYIYMDHNLYHLNTVGATNLTGGILGGSNIVDATPLFISTTIGSEDFTPTSESPVIQAGLNGTNIGGIAHAANGECPTPEPTPTITATPTATHTYTATQTPTVTETYTPLPTYTPQPTYTPEPTNTPYPTYTPEPTYTPGVGGARRPNVQYFGR